MTEGTIINIVRFCTDDGPGIRTTIFLKGCPLRCLWCHNPESQAFSKEIEYDAARCTGCGACAKQCTAFCHTVKNGGHLYQRDACLFCGKCADVCQNGALTIIGETIQAEKVLAIAKRDIPFYDASGGGITISGGEPLFQSAFTFSLLRLCRENKIHTAVETCGYTDTKTFEQCLSLCDTMLFDVKAGDAKKHMRLTGVDNEKILRNLQILDKSGLPYTIRLPIVPGFNDAQQDFEQIGQLLKTLKNGNRVEIMPYHCLGVYKYAHLGRTYQLADVKEPTQTEKNLWQTWLDQYSR